MNKGALALIGVAALGIAGAVGYRQFGDHPAFAQGTAPAAGPKAPARAGIAVEVAPVRLATVVEEIGAVGTLQANESVVIAPEIDGRISQILIEEGRKVEVGQPLVRFDDAILRGEQAQEQANLTLAQANFERADTLFQQRSGTQRARDEALAALQSARASADLARTRLEKATIRAPFTGVLGLRSVGPGEFVARGEPLVTIQSLDPLKVDFRVPETLLTAVRTGQAIKVTADALPGREFKGEIYAIDPQVDVNGRAIRLRARIPNPDDELRPGLFVRVTVAGERRENAVLVPEGAIVPQGDRRLVYRVADGKVAAVPVRIGQRRAGAVEVLEGLAEGDTVVTAGQQRLRDGQAVEIVNSAPRV
jgi:membrane fusion protein (multidrug efflux system)